MLKFLFGEKKPEPPKLDAALVNAVKPIAYIDQLKSAVRVVLPADEEYNSLRRPWNWDSAGKIGSILN